MEIQRNAMKSKEMQGKPKKSKENAPVKEFCSGYSANGGGGVRLTNDFSRNFELSAPEVFRYRRNAFVFKRFAPVRFIYSGSL